MRAGIGRWPNEECSIHLMLFHRPAGACGIPFPGSPYGQCLFVHPLVIIFRASKVILRCSWQERVSTIVLYNRSRDCLAINRGNGADSRTTTGKRTEGAGTETKDKLKCYKGSPGVGLPTPPPGSGKRKGLRGGKY